MRKISILVGLLAMSAASLQASTLAAGRSPKYKDDGTAPVMYPDDLGENNPCTEGWKIVLGYSGGYNSPANMAYAYDGIYGTAMSTNAEGSAQLVKPEWVNGFTIALEHSGGKRMMGGIGYRFLTNDDQKNTFTKADTYTDAVGAHPANFRTGASTQITAGEGKYLLNGQHDVLAYMSVPVSLFSSDDHCAGLGDTSFTLRPAIHFKYLDHKAEFQTKNLNAVGTSDALDIYKTKQKETTASGGPAVDVHVLKRFGKSFGVRGMCGISALGSSSTLDNKVNQFTANVDDGYLVNTKNTGLLSLNMVHRAGIRFLYALDTDDNGRFTFEAGWDGELAPNYTRLFGSQSGPSALTPQALQSGLVQARIGWKR